MSGSEGASQAPQKKQRAFGPIGWITSFFGLCVTTIIFIYIGMLLSILAEWIGMGFFYPEEGAKHSRQMLEKEYGYLSGDFRDTPYVSSTVVFANSVTGYVKSYSGFYVGFKYLASFDISEYEEAMAAEVMDGGSASDVAPWGAVVVYTTREYIYAALNIVILYAVRMTLLILSLPMFILFFVWGMVRGLNERDLRRWGVDRESAFVYSWSKAAVLPMLALPFVLYLAVPFSVHPSLIMLPCAIAEGFIVMTMARKFKKYL